MKKQLLSFCFLFSLFTLKTIDANAISDFYMCNNTSTDSASGNFYDSGGPGLGSYYQNGEWCYFLINPTCAAQITMHFTAFECESNYDSLFIWDGIDSLGTLQLAASGNSIPPDVACFSGAMFIKFKSDPSVQYDGWEAIWTSITCQNGHPTGAFTSLASPPLNVPIQFNDVTTGTQACRWHWDFGDGNSSPLKNPTHAFATSGPFTVSLEVYTCNDSDVVSHVVTVQAAPQIDVNPTTGFSASVACGDSATFPMGVSNLGGGQLVYNTNGTVIGNIKVLSMMYGSDLFQEYRRTLKAIRSNFTAFTHDSTGTNDPGTLSGLLSGVNVLLIPEHESGNDSSWLNMGPVIRQFLTNGGSVVFLGSGSSYANDLFYTGVFTGSFVNNEEFSTVSVLDMTHPLMAGLPSSSFQAPTATFAMDLTNPDIVPLAEVNGSDIVAYRYFGSGKAIFVAFDFYDTTNAYANKIVANAIEWGGENALPSWIHITPDSGTVNAGSTDSVHVTFVANSLPAGTYYATIGVASNDPVTPIVNVPCTLQVSGLPIVSLSVPGDSLNFGSIMQHTSLTDTFTLYNIGCDTLFISSIQSSDSKFSVLNGSIHYLLPGAFVDLVVRFTSNVATDTVSATITIHNNDHDTLVHVYGITYPAPILTSTITSAPHLIPACNETDSTTFVITNTGGSDLSYNIGPLPPWITLTPTSGVLSLSQSDTIHVTYGSGTFAGGNQIASIVITSNDPLTPTKTTLFTMAVDSNPCLTVTSASNTCTGFSTFMATYINTPTSFDWTFGDGAAASGNDTVTHGYPYNGHFNAKLIACNGHGCDTVDIPINAIITGPSATNCYPSNHGAACCQIGITRVQISDPPNSLIDNVTGDAVDDYQDYTCTDTCTLVEGHTYPITVLTGFGYQELVRMWIDVNGDSHFDSIAERFYSDSALTTHTGTFIIPCVWNNPHGVPLRMRLCSDFTSNAQPEPCLDPTFGQCEDYSVFITLGNCSGVNVDEIDAQTAFSVYPNPYNTSATIDYNLVKGSKVSVEITNILGERIGEFALDEMQLAGKHSYQFNNNTSGIYFVKLSIDDKSTVKRIVKM